MLSLMTTTTTTTHTHFKSVLITHINVAIQLKEIARERDGTTQCVINALVSTQFKLNSRNKHGVHLYFGTVGVRWVRSCSLDVKWICQQKFQEINVAFTLWNAVIDLSRHLYHCAIVSIWNGEWASERASEWAL